MWFRGSIDGAGGCPGHGADDSQSWIDTYSNPNKGVTREWVEAKVAPRSTPENMERLARLIADTDPVRGANYVAVSDGAVIGMCRTAIATAAATSAISVDKAWHGKGVGAALMERILDWVGPGRDVELHMATYNERARRFYNTSAAGCGESAPRRP